MRHKPFSTFWKNDEPLVCKKCGAILKLMFKDSIFNSFLACPKCYNP